MGVYFIYYAYVRVVFDWLNSPQLSGIFHAVANQFRPAYDIPGTSITMDFVFFDHFRYSVTNVLGVTYMWFQSTPVSAFLQNFVVSSSSAEMFWQWFVVIFCILVGLAFIAGLFTTLAAMAAFAYAVVMMLTTGIPFYSWWLLFAPFAFMFTGGKVLSLDYYVIPCIKRRWKNIPFIKKWYLYND